MRLLFNALSSDIISLEKTKQILPESGYEKINITMNV